MHATSRLADEVERIGPELAKLQEKFAALREHDDELERMFYAHVYVRSKISRGEPVSLCEHEAGQPGALNRTLETQRCSTAIELRHLLEVLPNTPNGNDEAIDFCVALQRMIRRFDSVTTWTLSLYHLGYLN